MDGFLLARENMVKGQVLPNKITNRFLINAVLEVPKHSFVPEQYKAISYSDEAIPLGEDRYMIPTMVLCRLLQAAKIKESDVVLDIACGSGYSSAVLAHLARKVVSIESCPELASKANFILNKSDVGNVIVLNNKLFDGHPDGAPYNVIVLNGAVNNVPQSLFEQMADFGRLVAIIKSENSGVAALFEKNGKKIERVDLFDVVVPLICEHEENIIDVEDLESK